MPLRRKRVRAAARRVAAGLVVLLLSAPLAEASFERSLEKMLGKQARDSIESQYPVIARGAAAQHVQRMGQSLVAASPRHDIEYTFRLLDTEQVNAFALPWGYVYVTTGMLGFVNSSDELAGVIGHEIAHVARKHSLDAFKKQFWASLLFGVIDAPATLLTLGKVGATFYLLRHSRQDEQEADRLGATYAYQAGYDPAQLAGFLRRLDEEHGRRLSTIEVYLSTHPTTGRRLERLAQLPELDPKSAQVAARLGEAFLARHLVNQAVVQWRRAVELAPNDAAAHQGLARAYAALGETDLARQALRRAVQLGARDDGEVERLLAQVPQSEPSSPVAAGQRDEQTIADARAAASAWRAAAQAPAREISDRAKALESRARSLAQRMDFSSAFARPTLAGQRVIEKAQLALYAIAETADHLRATGAGIESAGADALQAAELVERGLKAASDPRDQVQWQALARQIGAETTQGEEWREQATQRASEAAALAERAASELSSAIGTMSSDLDVFGGAERGFAFLGLAESEVDRALGTAQKALEAARKATSALRSWRTRELTWRLSAAYLDAPPAYRVALRQLAAAALGVELGALAVEQASGFGAAVFDALAGATGQEPAGQAPPASADAWERGVAEHGNALLQLLLRDVEREAEARSKWHGSAVP